MLLVGELLILVFPPLKITIIQYSRSCHAVCTVPLAYARVQVPRSNFVAVVWNMGVLIRV